MMRWVRATAFAAIAIMAADSAFAAAIEATRNLRRGTIVEAGDVMVSAKQARRGEAESMHEVIGMEVRASVREGRTIRLSDLRAPILIRRNQLVDIYYRNGTLVIRGEGRALRDGGAGQRIRVMNLDSRMVVTGRVTKSGSVEVSR